MSMVEYDNYGRMKYNPEYHGNDGKPWSQEDLMYLCGMHEAMRGKDLSMALERTETAIATKLYALKNKNKDLYDYYRKLSKSI